MLTLNLELLIFTKFSFNNEKEKRNTNTPDVSLTLHLLLQVVDLFFINSQNITYRLRNKNILRIRWISRAAHRNISFTKAIEILENIDRDTKN